MSEVFFEEMGIPAPRHNLGIGSGSHARQTAEMMVGLEDLMLAEQPDVVLVYGDTNSTLAAALVACKLNRPIAHVEAGLRSFNRTMPEEHNRVLTDHCSTLLFCPTDTAVRNLETEGIRGGVHQVGDTMYDAVLLFSPVAENRSLILRNLQLTPKEYYLATVHRPYNTDDPKKMRALLDAFARLERAVVFPCHPRTVARLQQFSLAVPTNVMVVEPIGYLDMLVLQRHARVILTDSGGVQKEAVFAGTPCVTLRPETEWVETVESGWNALAWGDEKETVAAVLRQESSTRQQMTVYGDGTAGHAIARLLAAAC